MAKTNPDFGVPSYPFCPTFFFSIHVSCAEGRGGRGRGSGEGREGKDNLSEEERMTSTKRFKFAASSDDDCSLSANRVSRGVASYSTRVLYTPVVIRVEATVNTAPKYTPVDLNEVC